MKHHRWLILVILLLPWFATPPALATTTTLEPLATQVRRSTVIATVTVEEMESLWEGDRIVTWVTARVDSAYKGVPSNRLTFATPGGRVGGIAMRVMTAPDFAVGERAIVFVAARGPGLRLVGLDAGKVPVETFGSTEMAALPDKNGVRRRVSLDVAAATISALAGTEVH